MKAWFETRGRGPATIQPGKIGQFDVIVDGQLAYSRQATGRFPSDGDLDRIASQSPS